MLSDWWKSAIKMALEDPRKIFLKSTENMKLFGFWGLNYPAYQFFEATFQHSVFPKL